MIIAVVRPPGGNKLLKSRSFIALASAGEKQTKFRFANEQAGQS